MKKQRISLLAVVTAVFVSFVLGFYWGRNSGGSEMRVSASQAMQTAPPPTTQVQTVPPSTTQPVTFPINLNTAGEAELLALPGVGEVLAQRILAYRQEHGGFESVEELLNVEGIGEKRFEQIWDLVTLEQ